MRLKKQNHLSATSHRGDRPATPADSGSVVILPIITNLSTTALRSGIGLLLSSFELARIASIQTRLERMQEADSTRATGMQTNYLQPVAKRVSFMGNSTDQQQLPGRCGLAFLHRHARKAGRMIAIMRLRRGWLRLLRSERGTSVIELSALSPMLLSMVLGLVDASLGFTAKLKLQQAATRSIEMATAGGISSPAFNSLADEAAAASGVSTSNITVTKWLECDGVAQNSFDTVCASGQQIGRYVSVTINSNYTPMLSSAMQAFGLPGTISIVGKASVRMQ